MENLISKTESISLFKVSKSHFEDMIKKYNIPKTRKDKCTYYPRDEIIKIASELEYRRQIRITEWVNTST